MGDLYGERTNSGVQRRNIEVGRARHSRLGASADIAIIENYMEMRSGGIISSVPKAADTKDSEKRKGKWYTTKRCQAWRTEKLNRKNQWR